MVEVIIQRNVLELYHYILTALKYIFIVHRSIAVMKVEIDRIASIAASLIGWTVKLVIMLVDTFKSDVVFICNITCLTLQWPIIFSSSVRSSILTIIWWDLRENVQIIDNLYSQYILWIYCCYVYKLNVWIILFSSSRPKTEYVLLCLQAQCMDYFVFFATTQNRIRNFFPNWTIPNENMTQ